jgi:hypothetical protein
MTREQENKKSWTLAFENTYIVNKPLPFFSGYGIYSHYTNLFAFCNLRPFEHEILCKIPTYQWCPKHICTLSNTGLCQSVSHTSINDLQPKSMLGRIFGDSSKRFAKQIYKRLLDYVDVSMEFCLELAHSIKMYNYDDIVPKMDRFSGIAITNNEIDNVSIILFTWINSGVKKGILELFQIKTCPSNFYDVLCVCWRECLTK